MLVLLKERCVLCERLLRVLWCHVKVCGEMTDASRGLVVGLLECLGVLSLCEADSAFGRVWLVPPLLRLIGIDRPVMHLAGIRGFEVLGGHSGGLSRRWEFDVFPAGLFSRLVLSANVICSE